jgi:trigger factor
MRVAVETTGELGRKMTVAIPADQVEQEIANRLKRLSKTVRLPGFRPGKAPLKIIEAKYGTQVLHEVAGQLIENSLRDALIQEGLHPAGGPDIEPKSLNRGSDLEYVASFDVFPEIKKLDNDFAREMGAQKERREKDHELLDGVLLDPEVALVPGK